MTSTSGIEILVRNCPTPRLLAWLVRVVGPLEEPTRAGDCTVLAASVGPVVLTAQVGREPITSVWFNAVSTPWPSDAACARQAAHELNSVVLCDPGPEYPGVHPGSDIWLQIDAQGEECLIALDR